MSSPLGIVDANRLTIEDAVMPAPSMRSTLLGWFRPMTLNIVRKTIVDFETKEVEVTQTTNGVIQPLTATQLAIKPEGERAWKWWMIHATTDLILLVDDTITVKGRHLRIIRQLPFEANGFIKYEAVEDYQNATG